jgi:hypothetical protein
VYSLKDFEFHELEEVLQYYPQSYYGVDKDGWHVDIMLLGNVDPNKLNDISGTIYCNTSQMWRSMERGGGGRGAGLGRRRYSSVAASHR